MALKIVFGSYRDWSNEIVEALKADGHDVLHCRKPDELTLAAVDAFQPQLFLLAGWSWYVPKEIFEKYEIIGLHPSLLPKYRGGSPIQNQIIAGETVGGVSLFRLTERFDEGPLYGQAEISLEGHLQEILGRITQSGIKLFRKLAEDYPDLKSWPQDDSQATNCTRRKPSQSELKPEDFSRLTARQLYNLARCLEDPYPNAFVTCADGKKIFLKRVELEE